MIFEACNLRNSITSYIESIFYFNDFNPEHSIERVVPTGHIFLLVELDGIERLTYTRTLKPADRFRGAWISGAHKDYLSISAPQNSSMLVVQFKPLSAFPFLKIPLHSIKNNVVDASSILGKDVLNIRRMIKSAVIIGRKFEIIQDWLETILQIDLIPPNEVFEFWENLQAQPCSKFRNCLAIYPFSHKDLIYKFKKYNGLTPKDLHQILRFNDMLMQIKNKEEISWSNISYQCGYADQSHFIKAFKKFSGFNPQEFIRNDFHNQDTIFFPVT